MQPTDLIRKSAAILGKPTDHMSMDLVYPGHESSSSGGRYHLVMTYLEIVSWVFKNTRGAKGVSRTLSCP
jgi:hypothetical protein